MALNSNGSFINQRDQNQPSQQPEEYLNLVAKEKDLYKRIFDSLPAIVFIKDKNNQLLEFNKTFEEFMRIAKGELLSKSTYELFPDAEKYHKDDLEVIETGKPKFNIIEEVIVPGDVVWLKTDKVPLKNDKDEVIGVLGISQDITHQKNIQDKLAATQEKLRRLNNELEERAMKRTKELMESNEELKRINTDLDNFIYIASHDLKSPIDNIDGFILFLRESLKDRITHDEEKVFERIIASVDRFRKTIGELHKITKVQRNLEDSIEEVDLNEIIEDIKAEIFFTIQNANARIITSFDVPVINYGKKNIMSILYNLITNAIKFRSPERNPVVKISTKKDAHGIMLSVEDNGLGLAPDEKDKLFIMFKRLHDHVEGTGVGLYIVKRIVENNGGKIEVESEKGKSTTFKILIKKSTKHVAV
ncbi:MAG TPA: ATP-binding protein [Chitinophagaceae bacterium]|jgi:PAS domain S-box-containing protein